MVAEWRTTHEGNAIIDLRDEIVEVMVIASRLQDQVGLMRDGGQKCVRRVRVTG
jgi:hypothetical protein